MGPNLLASQQVGINFAFLDTDTCYPSSRDLGRSQAGMYYWTWDFDGEGAHLILGKAGAGMNATGCGLSTSSSIE